uniref:Apolipoprotein C-I n=1 Tax=Eonycteris spelaea TaxID=58065 RepID=APOC1_EONSP|nr:RecName: Full=Apolipoprotein C-I; Short=Apo-CI; Short=ApoC-I; AltName: Full=Apolipoprotein C1; Contains: RecName: Full=Truncated apolipoprotein C-I; Flags: Precursor [Eonycteris spelaea]
MRLILSLPVLAVVLAMVLEGPAPAQAAPDISSAWESIPEKLEEFGRTVKEKVRTAIDHIKKSDFPEKTRKWFSEMFDTLKEKF